MELCVDMDNIDIQLRTILIMCSLNVLFPGRRIEPGVRILIII